MNGEYTNTICFSKESDSSFKMWIWAENIDSITAECDSGEFTSPDDFMANLGVCLDFVDFGDYCEYEMFNEGLPKLKKLDAKFAKQLKDYLLDQHGKEYFEEATDETPKESGRGTFRKLTNQEALREYGASFSSISTPRPKKKDSKSGGKAKSKKKKS